MALSRKQSREVAYRALFALSYNNTPEWEPVSGPEGNYIDKLCAAVVDNLEAIDGIIKQHSKGFSFDRIFKTDLTALRMGIAEVKFFEGTPAVVAINEAVEIAKKYGTEKSGTFVNGILAAVLNG